MNAFEEPLFSLRNYNKINSITFKHFVINFKIFRGFFLNSRTFKEIKVLYELTNNQPYLGKFIFLRELKKRRDIYDNFSVNIISHLR